MAHRGTNMLPKQYWIPGGAAAHFWASGQQAGNCSEHSDCLGACSPLLKGEAPGRRRAVLCVPGSVARSLAQRPLLFRRELLDPVFLLGGAGSVREGCRVQEPPGLVRPGVLGAAAGYMRGIAGVHIDGNASINAAAFAFDHVHVPVRHLSLI